MSNPWTKKNPFLSMWLSGANAAMGAARGHMMAQTQRQTNAMMAQSARAVTDFWANALSPSARRTKR